MDLKKNDGSEVCFDLLRFLSGLHHEPHGLSGCVLDGSSMTRLASLCTLSSFSRFVCAIVVRPSP